MSTVSPANVVPMAIKVALVQTEHLDGTAITVLLAPEAILVAKDPKEKSVASVLTGMMVCVVQLVTLAARERQVREA